MNLRRSAQIGLLALTPLLGACEKDTQAPDEPASTESEVPLTPADFASLDVILAQHQDVIEREIGECAGPVSYQTLYIADSSYPVELSFAGSSQADVFWHDGHSARSITWICSQNSRVAGDGIVPHAVSECMGMLKIDMQGRVPRFFSVDAECGADAAGAEYVRKNTWGETELKINPAAFWDQTWRDGREDR